VHDVEERFYQGAVPESVGPIVGDSGFRAVFSMR